MTEIGYHHLQYENTPLAEKFKWFLNAPGSAAVAPAYDEMSSAANLYSGSDELVGDVVTRLGHEWRGVAAGAAGTVMRRAADWSGATAAASGVAGGSVDGYGQSFEQTRASVHWDDPGQWDWWEQVIDAPGLVDTVVLGADVFDVQSDFFAKAQVNRTLDSDAIRALQAHEDTTRLALATFPTVEPLAITDHGSSPGHAAYARAGVGDPAGLGGDTGPAGRSVSLPPGVDGSLPPGLDGSVGLAPSTGSAGLAPAAGLGPDLQPGTGSAAPLGSSSTAPPGSSSTAPPGSSSTAPSGSSSAAPSGSSPAGPGPASSPVAVPSSSVPAAGPWHSAPDGSARGTSMSTTGAGGPSVQGKGTGWGGPGPTAGGYRAPSTGSAPGRTPGPLSSGWGDATSRTADGSRTLGRPEGTSSGPGFGSRLGSGSPDAAGQRGVTSAINPTGSGRPGAAGTGLFPMMGGMGSGAGAGSGEHKTKYWIPSSEAFDVPLPPHTEPVIEGREELC